MWAALGLLAITVVGLVLRLWGLDGYGVTFDEAYHVALVRLPDVGSMLDAALSNPPSDPLYVLLLRPLVQAFGHGDALIRAPSVIVGTLTIPAAAWLGREVTRSWAVALLGAAFLAASPYALEFSQEAAPYALATLGTTLALAAAWRWRHTGAAVDAVALVGFGILAAYSHYVAVAVLGLVAILGASRRAGPIRPTRTRWLGAFALVLAAWAPWAVASAAHWATAAAPRSSLPHAISVEELVNALVGLGAGTASVVQALRPLEVVALLAGAVLMILGWVAGREPDRRGLRVLTLTAAIIFLGPAIASALTGEWLFIAHFSLLMLPALLVVAAAGAIALARSHRVAAAGLSVVWLAVSLAGVALFYADPPHGRDGLREMAASIAAQAGPDDVILVAPAILQPPLAQYLPDQPLRGIPDDFDLRDIYGPFARPPSDDALTTAVLRAAGDHARVWLVLRPELDPDRVIVATLGRRYTLGAQEQSPFATLYRFDAQAR